MFCHKCGAEIADGSAFCYKCGAQMHSTDSSMQVDDSSQMNTTQVNHVNEQNVVSSSVGPAQVQSQTVALGKTGKKKSRKLPLILGIVILIVAILVVVIAVVGRSNDDTSSHSGVSLSETYTNESEGISFQYPGAWELSDPAEYFSTFSDMQDSVVLLINKTGQELNSVIEVLKFSVDQGTIEHLFVSDEEFTATFDDDVSIMETSIVEIGGIEAREIAYIEQDELYYLSYMYGVNSTLYRINFICHKDQKGSFERFYDAIIESYTITTTAETPTSSNSVTDDNDYLVFAEALWNLFMYNTLPDGEIANDLDGKIDGMWDKFAICDINQDGVAELLIKIGSGSEAAQGQYIYQVNYDHTDLEMLYSFFTDVVYYDTGFIKEDWSHNQGLSENFWPYNILQWELGGCREVAGADAWEKMAWETDFSGNAFPDDVDTDGNGIVYFIGRGNGIDYDNPVDDAEYNVFVKNFLGAGNEIYVPWRDITEENIETATGYTSTTLVDSTADYGDPSVNMPSGFSEPLEYYSELSGFYEGSTGQSSLSVSIYTSWEEKSIGTVGLYVDDEWYYLGEIIAESEKDVYLVETDTGEEVVFDVHSGYGAYLDYGIIVIDLYVDGQYIDEYLMVEHYES